MSTYSTMKGTLSNDPAPMPENPNSNYIVGGEVGGAATIQKKTLILGKPAQIAVNTVPPRDVIFDTEEEFWTWLKENNITCPFDWTSAAIGAGVGLGVGLLIWLLFK